MGRSFNDIFVSLSAGGGGGGSIDGLLGAYQSASGASRNIVTITNALGPVLVRNASGNPSGPIFGVQTNGGGATLFVVDKDNATCGVNLLSTVDNTFVIGISGSGGASGSGNGFQALAAYQVTNPDVSGGDLYVFGASSKILSPGEGSSPSSVHIYPGINRFTPGGDQPGTPGGNATVLFDPPGGALLGPALGYEVQGAIHAYAATYYNGTTHITTGMMSQLFVSNLGTGNATPVPGLGFFGHYFGATPPLVATLWYTGDFAYGRRIAQGTATVAGDYALSGTWGSTASVSVTTNSNDSRGRITVTCNGSGIGANPTITFTFKDGIWWNSTDVSGNKVSFVPFAMVSMCGGTGVQTPPTWTVNGTTLTITLPATPGSGLTYIFEYSLLG
jgi:hypothetical protein